jgi:4-amino-4-deoxy-L-arabinose transferase-like glycosyltransferase
MVDRPQREGDPWLALSVILLLGLWLRLWGLDFGLPNIYCRPDETILVHRALAIASGGLNPHFFNYPSFQFYLLAIVYGIYFVVGYIGGQFSNVSEFEQLYFFDPSSFFLYGRLLTAFMGTASIAVVYFIGRELQNPRTGLLAAFFVAFSFLHVRDSHFLTVDVPALFYGLLSILFALRFFRIRSWRGLVTGGIFLGLAVSTKYNLGLFAPVVVWSLFASTPAEKRFKYVLLLSGVVVAAFLCASPYIVLDFATFWRDLSFERTHFAHGHGLDLGWGWLYHARFSLPLGLGWPLFILSIVGLVDWAWRGTHTGRALLVGFLCYYGVSGSGKLVFMRYALPLIPLLCLAAAALLEQLGRRFLPRGTVWAVAVIVVASTAYASWQHSGLLAQTDTRVLAAKWIEEHVETGASVAICGVSDYDFIRLRRTSRQMKDELRQQRAAGLSARRLERQLVYASNDVRPVYEVVELLLSDLSQRDQCSASALVSRRIRWLVIHERDWRMGGGTSMYNPWRAVIGLESVQRFDPFSVYRHIEPIYDAIDAFYLPVRGFGAITRPGPRISIYNLGLGR